LTNEGAPRRADISSWCWTHTVSWAGYAVRIKPFILLASVTCQDSGKAVLA
jgi:hypothetical protein